jgi:hypothetical protein
MGSFAFGVSGRVMMAEMGQHEMSRVVQALVASGHESFALLQPMTTMQGARSNSVTSMYSTLHPTLPTYCLQRLARSGGEASNGEELPVDVSAMASLYGCAYCTLRGQQGQ